MSEAIGLAKIKGSIFGGAIGDAMGGPVESFDAKFVEEHFGGRIEDLAPYADCGPHWYTAGSPAGAYTDDTIVKNVLCAAIIKNKGRINARRFAKVYAEEMREDYFLRSRGQLWPGEAATWFKLSITLEQGYEDMLQMPDARELGQGNLPACDAAMIISPIGLINPGDPFRAAEEAMEVSSVLQSGISASAPSAIAAAVAMAMLPGAALEDVLEAAVENTDAQTSARISKAVDLARESSHPFEFKRRFYETMLVKTADVLEVVPAAFGILALTKGEFSQAVIEAANFGRDCDTIAGIAGSIAGAWNGLDAIPAKWIEAVRSANADWPSLDGLSQGIYEALRQERARCKNLMGLWDALLG